MTDTIGVFDNSGVGTKPVHTEPGPSQTAAGAAIEQQVVQLEEKRGVDAIVRLLSSMDERLSRIEVAVIGFTED